MKELLAIGKFGRTTGIGGEIRFFSFSEELKYIHSLRSVLINRGGEYIGYSVEKCAARNKSLVLKLEGIDSPEAAQRLTNCIVWVGRSSAAPLNKGEYYYADLEECTAYLNGQPVGIVESVWNNGVNDFLNIRIPHGRNVMVPFLDRYIGTVDITGQRIDILEEWFFLDH